MQEQVYEHLSTYMHMSTQSTLYISSYTEYVLGNMEFSTKEKKCFCTHLAQKIHTFPLNFLNCATFCFLHKNILHNALTNS